MSDLEITTLREKLIRKINGMDEKDLELLAIYLNRQEKAENKKSKEEEP